MRKIKLGELGILEKINVYGLGDFHCGHRDVDLEKLRVAVEIIQIDPNPKRVYLLGDLLESADKRVGDSVYWQDMALDEQIETVTQILMPIRKHIAAYCIGNHESRVLKDFNLNVAKFVGRELRCPVTIQCHDKIRVGQKEYRIFAAHGFGGAKRLETAISKIYNDTKDIMADIVLYGHLHYLTAYKKYLNDMGEPRPKILACTGHFFNRTPDYAQIRLYPPSPPGFVKIEATERDLSYRVYEL